jgi:hypothetical protein
VRQELELLMDVGEDIRLVLAADRPEGLLEGFPLAQLVGADPGEQLTDRAAQRAG